MHLGVLVDGTMLRGMFEERIKGIIDEAKEHANLILFIDEAHTIMALEQPWEPLPTPRICLSRR
jgi:ATP-dependent Clp protease ATP-binding subunit ClpA